MADWSLLGIVTASLVVFGASLIVFTVPTDHILSAGFNNKQQNAVTVSLVILFICVVAAVTGVITSYSIHYTKLYEWITLLMST